MLPGDLEEARVLLTQTGSEQLRNLPAPRIAFAIAALRASGRHSPEQGEIFRNPALASTYQAMADGSAKAGGAQGACDVFYNGSIAQKLSEYFPTVGIRLTSEDLAGHHGDHVEPAFVTYRNESTRVYELPPNPQGLAALQMLNMMELGPDPHGPGGHNGADFLHWSVEAKKLAFADRAKYYADPDFANVPVEGLISKQYAAERAKLIDPSRAAKQVDPGNPFAQN